MKGMIELSLLIATFTTKTRSFFMSFVVHENYNIGQLVFNPSQQCAPPKHNIFQELNHTHTHTPHATQTIRVFKVTKLRDAFESM